MGLDGSPVRDVFDAFDMVRGLLLSAGTGRRGANVATPNHRGEGVGLRLQALAAAAKEKQPETHDVQQRNRAARGCRIPYHYAGWALSRAVRGQPLNLGNRDATP
ncbi:hypothetical protein GCM10023324_33610 [Streptomyces youssoufiensis]